MREYCLDVIGIKHWAYRFREQVPCCSLAVSEDLSWALIAETELNDSAGRLFQAIANVLRIKSSCEKTPWDSIALDSAQTRVLILGKSSSEWWRSSHLSAQFDSGRFLLSHGINDMLSDPLLKRDLWQRLSPLLEVGS